MRTKKVVRYYCDHCAKGMFKKPSMARHELVCYRNPKRVCHRCNNNPDHCITGERKRELIDLARNRKPIATKASECPDCLMAYCIRFFQKLAAEETVMWYDREQYNRDRIEWDRRGWKLGRGVHIAKSG